MQRSLLSILILSLCSSMVFANEQTLSSQEQLPELSAIQVEVSQEQDVAHQASSTKFEHHVLDVPFNRSFVSEDMMQKNNIQRVDDALYQVSGVFHQSNYGGGYWDNYSFRGFNTDPDMGATTIRNGSSVNRGINTPKDMLNIQSMDFVKGAGASVYGRGETGGLLNITTKQPKWEKKTILKTTLNTQDKYRLSLEHTAPINDKLASRVAIAGENNQSFRDHVENKRLFISSQLAWKISDHTSLLFENEFLRQKGVFDRGISAQKNNQITMNRKTFTGEPSDINTLQDLFYQLRLNHQFNDEWQVKSGLSYKKTTLQGVSTEPRVLLDENTLARFRRSRDNYSLDVLWNADVLGKINTDWAKHEILISGEMGQLQYRQHLLRRNPIVASGLYLNPIDIRHGQQVYNNNLYQLKSTDQNEDFKEQQRYFAINVQDQMFFNDKLSALAGVRFDYVKQRFDNYNTKQYQQSVQQKNHHQLSPRVGINYKINPDLSVYANYGRSFAMNARLDEDGKNFEPERGENYEVGAKYQFNANSLISMALFNANKKNVLTYNNDSGYYMAVGEHSSRGIELDFNYQYNDKLNLNAAYAYTKAQVEKDITLAKGSRLSNIPKHSGSVSVNYEFLQQDARKAGLGGTVAYIGERSGNYIDTGFNLPAYTLVNTHAYYQPSERVRYQLNVNNLLDKTYYPASYSNLWIQAGEPRNASLSMQWKF